jgi:hypothetical protein
VRRAAASLASIYNDPGLSKALATFDASTPLVKDFRDLFEHFDEYDKGTGDRQKKRALPGSRLAEKYKFPLGDATLEAYGQNSPLPRLPRRSSPSRTQSWP